MVTDEERVKGFLRKNSQQAYTTIEILMGIDRGVVNPINDPRLGLIVALSNLIAKREVV
jgi:hypothetical protein